MSLTLQKAVKIYDSMNNILVEGKSSFLSESKPITKHKICDLMSEFNNEAILYEYYYMYDNEDFLKSLKVDDIEVIGFKKEERRSFYSYGKRFYVDSEKICELSTPSHFGKGTETVYDETVRKATEITADRITITGGIDLTENFKNIVPPRKKFEFKLYKMQIYKKGGMFTKHKDTIHAPNHYATLVVFIPTKYLGGDLCLYNKGELVKKIESSNYFQMIIFLTDLEHEVLPVIDGTRIVLQYDVYLIDKEDDEEDETEDEEDDEEEDEDETEPFYDKKNNSILTSNLIKSPDEIILKEIEKFADNHPNDEICLLLSRRYPLFISTEYLKASDKYLYDILKEKYDIKLGLVVNRFESSYDDTYDIDERKRLQVMNYSDIERFLKYHEEEGDSCEDIKKDDKIKTYIFIAEGDFTCIFSRSYVEHTGNEAAPALYSYVSLAFCIRKKK